jgi:molybdenum cofactor biosynthesis enzyme MoaA
MSSPKQNPLAEAMLQYSNFRLCHDARTFCFAPSNAMYFAHGGKMLSCCFNRAHPLGTYPNEDPVEAWKGEKRRNLKDKLAAFELDAGCHFCREQLISGNFSSLGSLYFDHFQVTEHAPSVLHFEISSRCNLNCIMCMSQNSDTVLKSRMHINTPKEVYDAAFTEKIKEFYPGLQQARFFGGEPFLIPLYEKIWKDILDVNPDCSLSVQTNGTVLNERVRGVMERGNFHIGLSVDSLDQKKYAAIRRNATLDLFLQNFKYFIDYRNRKGTFTGVSICPQKLNYRELPEMLLYFGYHDVPVHFNVVWIPFSQALWPLSSTTLDNILSEYKSVVLPLDTEVQHKNRNTWDDYLSLLLHWRNLAAERESQSLTGENAWLNNVVLRLSSHISADADYCLSLLTEKLKAAEKYLKVPIQTELMMKWLSAFPDDILVSSLLVPDEISFAEIALDLIQNPYPDRLIHE